MDNRREPQMHFRWYRDSDGYALSDDQKRIVRLGGKLTEYDPAKCSPQPHLVFVAVSNNARTVTGSCRGGVAHDLNLCACFTSWALNFVNTFGLLGSDRTGANAESESVDYLRTCALKLSGVRIWQQLPRPFKQESAAGPNVRMMIARRDDGSVSVRYEPESLYAWMWLRTGEEFLKGLRWDGEPCHYCYRPFGRGPGGSRSDAKFCSGNCRKYFNRLTKTERRKHIAQARELARTKGG